MVKEQLKESKKNLKGQLSKFKELEFDALPNSDTNSFLC